MYRNCGFAFMQGVGERSKGSEAGIVRSCGALRSENVGMSSEMGVRIPHIKCPRFPTQRSSTWG